MADSLSSLLTNIYSYLLVAYGQSVNNASGSLFFQSIGTPISPSDLKINATDTSYSPAVAVELFSQLVNKAPSVTGVQVSITDRLVDDFYNLALTDSLPSSQDQTTVTQFELSRTSAQQQFAPTLGSMKGPYPFHPSYATPTDWYDPSSATNWTSFSTTTSTAPQVSSEVAASVVSMSGWKTTAGGTLSPSSGGFSIAFDYCLVQVARPWFSGSFLYNLEWYLAGRPIGWLSSGDIQDSGALLPSVAIGFVTIKDLKISANWSVADAQLANQAIGLAFFSLAGSTFDSTSISAPGTQIIAWICQPNPVLPPHSDPALPDVNLSTVLSDATEQFGGPPFCTFSVTMKDLTLISTIKASGDLTMGLTATMVEQSFNNCPYPTIPTNVHQYNGNGVLDGLAVSLNLTPSPNNAPQCNASIKGSITSTGFVGLVTIERTDESGNLAWRTQHYAGAGSDSVNVGSVRYKPTESGTFAIDEQQIYVTRTPSIGGFHFQVQFVVPPSPASTFPGFTLIAVYGYQILSNGSRIDLPPSTLPQITGNWSPAESITFDFDAPQNVCDPSQGWNIRFGIGSLAETLPSPNLLTGAPV